MPLAGFQEPAAPIVPQSAQITPGELLTSGAAGLAAFTHMAIARQQAQTAEQALLQSAALATDQHNFEREKMAQDYDLATQHLALTKEAADRNYEIQSGLRDSQEYMNYAHGDAFQALEQYRLKAGGFMAKNTAQTAQTLSEFTDQMDKMDLLNPKVTDPVEFYAKVRRLKDEYAFTNLPQIKNSLKQLDLRVQQQTIPLAIDPKVTVDNLGNAKTTWSSKPVPIGSVVENLMDPQKSEETWQALERSGYARPATTTPPEDPNKTIRGESTTAIDRATHALTGYPKYYQAPDVTTRGLDLTKPGASTIAAGIKSGQSVDFSRGTSRATDATPAPLFPTSEAASILAQAKAAIAAGKDPNAVKALLDSKGIDTSNLLVPAPAQPPTFPQTDADRLKSQARAAIARGADPDAVTQRLSDMGVDASDL